MNNQRWWASTGNSISMVVNKELGLIRTLITRWLFHPPCLHSEAATSKWALLMHAGIGIGLHTEAGGLKWARYRLCAGGRLLPHRWGGVIPWHLLSANTKLPTAITMQDAADHRRVPDGPRP